MSEMQINQRKIPGRKIQWKRNFRQEKLGVAREVALLTLEIFLRTGNFRKYKQEFLVQWKARLKNFKFPAQITMSNSSNQMVAMKQSLGEWQYLNCKFPCARLSSTCVQQIQLRQKFSLLPHFYNFSCYETQIPGYLEREL